LQENKKHIDLSIIIVNYNVRYFLEQCLLSVQDACKAINAEVIVVDNNSKDDSCEMLVEKFPTIKLIVNKDNTGFSKANNQGVEIAKGEYVLILNPDTVVAEDTFKKILEFVNSKTDFGVLGVKLVDGTGVFLPESKRGVPTPKVSFSKLTGFSKKQTKKYYASHLKQNETGKVEILVGAFMLIKTKVYNEVNGFDEDYFMYGEDIDLSYKILKKGYQNYYFADTQIIHYKGESTSKDSKYLKRFYGAMKIFYKKHFKPNIVFDLLMNMGIYLMLLLKSFKIKTDKELQNTLSSFIYIGNNAATFAKIKNKIKPTLAINHTAISINDILSNKIDTVIFDNNSISNQEIIAAIQQLNDKIAKNRVVSFRFIPRNCNYFIGSDNSVDKGNVVVFDV